MKVIYIKALLGLYGLIFISSLLQGCCQDRDRYTGDGSIAFFQEGGEGQELDTVSRDFFVRVYFDHQTEQAYLNNMSLASAAYALTCRPNFVNTLRNETFRLTVNPSFVYQGDSIVNEYNLLELTTIDTTMHVRQTYLSIDFLEAFFDNATFADTTYTFTFTGSTSDNIPFDFEKEVWIGR